MLTQSTRTTVPTLLALCASLCLLPRAASAQDITAHFITGTAFFLSVGDYIAPKGGGADICLFTQRTPRLTVTEEGNIGIGVLPFFFDPRARLEINTDISGSTDASLRCQHTNSNFIVRPYAGLDTTTVLENTSGGGLYINSNLGIWCKPGSYPLDVNGTARFRNNVGINGALTANGGLTVNGGSSYTLYVNGKAGATLGFLSLSDARYKQNIHTLPSALETVQKLRGVSFEWRRDEWKDKHFEAGRRIGFIAQEVEQVLPELVNTDAQGYKSVAYSNVVPVLVEAIKQQQEQIDALKAQNQEIASLKAQMAALTARMARNGSPQQVAHK